MSRPKQDEKYAIAKHYGITSRRLRGELTPKFIEQLRRCKSEAARRLLLGVSRRVTERHTESA